MSPLVGEASLGLGRHPPGRQVPRPFLEPVVRPRLDEFENVVAS